MHHGVFSLASGLTEQKPGFYKNPALSDLRIYSENVYKSFMYIRHLPFSVNSDEYGFHFFWNKAARKIYLTDFYVLYHAAEYN
ncbi:MAG: hypothetical protein BWK80_22520 [Desulfobacteraceae bacterium IS3]|nr:MAG: hypothetical protein BWK80_22520 [Desulfobacteraceae bacterium IS3]